MYSFFFIDDDFVDDGDLFVACKILQKQIDVIGGRKENIIIPMIAMKNYDEKEQEGINKTMMKNRLKLNIIIF